MISLGDDRLVMLEKAETFCSRKEFSFFSVRDFELILFAADLYAFFLGLHNCSDFLRYEKYTKYTDCYRLVCFLTDFVFVVLVACFDETMVSIGGY